MKRSIKQIHNSIYAPVADLETWRPMPTRSLPSLDPFLFVNHHGPQHYGPNNNGLPFGPHPHRGFETLTLVLRGDITHKDSVTGESVITAGGIQWMTAGKGLIHAEVSSDEFKRIGGEEEVIQLWLNLPSHLKMVEPNYIGLQKEEIPAISFDEGRGVLNLFSGSFQGEEGPVQSLTELFTSTIFLNEGGRFIDQVAGENQVLFYVIEGKVKVNGQEVGKHQLVEFEFGGEEIEVEASEDSKLIFNHGKPLNEPIVAHGPFVMNTESEIRQAFLDYQSGKLGDPNALM